MSDNRTSEPTPEQVERAYRAFCEARLGRAMTDEEHEATRSRLELTWIGPTIAAATTPSGGEPTEDCYLDHEHEPECYERTREHQQRYAPEGAPTDAQVEAAAEGMWDRYGDRGMFQHAAEHMKNAFRKDARAALVAAQGAAPQAEAPRDLLVLAKHLHGRYGRNQPRIWERLSGELQAGWLIEAENVPNICPVLPSSSVDVAKIESLILGRTATAGARAVAEWLKGQGGESR